MIVIKKILVPALVALGVAAATPALAADNYLFGFSPFGTQILTLNGSTVIQAFDTGWIGNDGVHTTSNDNYIVGDCDSCGAGLSFNDYFQFDLSGVNFAITSAVLSIGNGNGYTAGLLSTYSLFDVNSAYASLDVERSSGDLTGMSLFNDLQSGLLYGSRSITNVVQNSQVDTTLNADALIALNGAAGGNFAIGGTLRPGDVVPPSTNGGVPEPATWALMLSGFGLAGAALRRRRTFATA